MEFRPRIQAHTDTLAIIHQKTGLVVEPLLELLNKSLQTEFLTPDARGIGSGLFSPNKTISLRSLYFLVGMVTTGALRINFLLQSFVLQILLKLKEEIHGARKDLASLYGNVVKLVRILLVDSVANDFEVPLLTVVVSCYMV